MNWKTFQRIHKKMIEDGFLTEHKLYSDDGNNTFLEIYYKINYGKMPAPKMILK